MRFWHHTKRGRRLDLENPQFEDIDLLEIAHTLAQANRYAGNTHFAYSVAEHSCLMAGYLAKQGASRDLVLGALLHDAAEFVMGDVPYPLQALLWAVAPEAKVAYKAAQARLNVLIGAHAKLDPRWLDAPEVHSCDLRICIDEREVLLDPNEDLGYCWDLDEFVDGPLGVTIEGWTAEQARRNFVAQLSTLGAL